MRKTYSTVSASKKQILLEKEYNDLLIKSNTMTVIGLFFILTVIGMPIGLLILLFSRPFKTFKKLKQLEREIEEEMLRNAKD